MSTFDRRRFLRLGGAGTVVALSGCLDLVASGGSSGDPAPWSAFGGGPERTWARTAAEAVTGPVTEAWSLDLAEYPFLAAVVDGAAFVLSEDRILAVDVASGDELWDYGLSSRTSGLSVTGGTVYVGAEGRLQTLDAADGSEGWSVDAAETTFATPIASDGYVYAIGSNLQAFDVESGTEQWEYGSEEFWERQPTVDGTDVYFRPTTTELACVRQGESELTWSYSSSMEQVYPPGVGDELLYAGGSVENDADSGAVLSAFDPDSGERQWTYEGDSEFVLISSPAIGDDALYVTFEKRDGSGGLAAIDTDGDERWRTSFDRDVVGPSLFGDTVYAAVGSELVGLAASDGRQLFGRSFDALNGTPIVVDDRIFATAGETIYALESA